jgi:hypothetical protein
MAYVENGAAFIDDNLSNGPGKFLYTYRTNGQFLMQNLCRHIKTQSAKIT